MTLDNVQKVTLFEYAAPVLRDGWINYCPGVWRIQIKNDLAGVQGDDLFGFYDDYSIEPFFVISARVGAYSYAEMLSLLDCIATQGSFFFDPATYTLYINGLNSDSPENAEVYAGYAKGYSKNATTFFYNGFYYDPRVSKVYPLKKSIDPLFYGLLKYQGGNVELINADGEFDDWRTRNLYGQACRVITGDADAAYTALTTIGTGFIENDSRDFDTISVTMQDPRKALTVPVALNNYTLAEYSGLGDSNIDKPKPMAYGQIFNAPAVCTNETTITTTGNFHFCDTTYNDVASVESVYVDGVDHTADATVSLTAGTFTIPVAHVTGLLDKVTVYFTVSPSNGVDIIKDLLLNFDGKTYISSFFDTTEIDLAQASARNTSIYIDSNVKLSEAIESVCNDLDARFFAHDDGKYTIRLYDAARTPVKTIERDEWLNNPSFTNNGNEFLTSAIVTYAPDRTDNTITRQTEYKVDEAAAYARYKTYKKETFKTNLILASDATAKAANIMAFSANVADIISRSTHWAHSGLEITDFIICDPVTRVNDTEVKAVYEIIGIAKDVEKLSVNLTLRYVTTDPTVYYAYSSLIDDNSAYVITDDDEIILITEVL